MLLTATLAGGCGVSSKNPLGNPEAAVVDAKLMGMWNLRMPDEDDGAAVFLHIGRAEDGGDSGLLRCLAVFHNLRRTLPPASMAEMFTTEIGNRRLLNVKWLAESGSGQYSFLKYDVDDEQLRLYPLRKEPVAQAIEKDEIAGSLSWAVVTQSVNLTEDPDSLLKFMARTDDETLFGSSTNLVFDHISR